MKRNLVTILILAAVILLLLGSGFLYNRLTAPQVQTSAEEPAEPAPVAETQEEPAAPDESTLPEEATVEDSDLVSATDFVFTDSEGNTYHLSDFYGKPIIINFWATWCGPCQRELPYFNDAFAAYGDRIQFFMMDLVDGSYETEDSTIQFVNGNGYQFPLFFDSEGEGAMAYGVNAIPFTVVIDANGKIVETHLGSMSEADLQELIDKVL